VRFALALSFRCVLGEQGYESLSAFDQ